MKKKDIQCQIILPSSFERQKIFYWLKRISSLTAWRRIFSYYNAWANATENSLRVADENGWGLKTSLPQAEYALILKCLAHCEEGVIRLSKGDNRIFKFDEHGEFAMAARMMSHWIQMLERIRLGENALDPDTPLWTEFRKALLNLAEAWGECGPHILEPRYFEDPAPVSFGPWLKHELKMMWFPADLQPVPNPLENFFTRTGENISCSGIWEPVYVPKRSLVSLFTSAPKPQPPFETEGTMNYLHSGSKAPQVNVDIGNESINVDTTWRLIWRDDRYNHETIPNEESTYRFQAPVEVPPSFTSPIAPHEIVWAYSGSRTLLPGRWLVESDLTVNITLREGELLPQHQGRDVKWVLAEN